MPAEKAKELYLQGVELLVEAEKTDDKRKLQDAASLIMLAVKGAEEPFPDAEATLASIYIFHLKDVASGWKYVKSALLHDPNHFPAQHLRVSIAFVEFKTGTSFTGFHLSREGNLNSQARELRDIFQRQCVAEISADRFLDFGQTLLNLADVLAETSSFSVKNTAKGFYEAVASASIQKIVCEDEEQRKQVTRLQSIALGRSQL